MGKHIDSGNLSLLSQSIENGQAAAGGRLFQSQDGVNIVNEQDAIPTMACLYMGCDIDSP